MRLYLSSYRLGASADRLLALLDGGHTAAVINNALDFIPDAARLTYRQTQYDPFAELGGLGLEPHDLDLRQYFGRAGDLRERLSRYDLIWATGGNAFLLLRAMDRSGFSGAIRSMLETDDIVYGGFSAGAVVATPTLRGIEIMDSPTQLADGYDPEIIWDGLGLVDFSIVPHFRSDHPEAGLAEKAAEYFRANAMPFNAIRDGDVIIRSGDRLDIWPKDR